MSQNIPTGKQQFVDINGKPLVGGFVFNYLVGTTTPKTTYQDSGLSIANANPIVLDSRGQCSMYGSGNYRQLVQDSTSVTIWDQVIIDSFQAYSGSLANNTDPAQGAGLIGYKGRTAYAKMSDIKSVQDFGAVGDGATDDTAAIQAAINTGGAIYLPRTANGYRVTATITVPLSSTVIFGDGGNFSSYINLNGHTFDVFLVTAPSDVEFRNISSLNFSPPGAVGSQFWFIRCDNTASVTILDCNSNYLQSGILMGADGTGTTGGANSRISGCSLLHLGQGSGQGVHYGGAAEVRTIVNCVISGPGTGSAGASNAASGVSVTGGAAIVIDNVECIGCGVPLLVRPATGNSVVHLKANLLWCDSSSSVGLWLDGSAGQIIGASFDQLWASSSQIGVRITGFVRDVALNQAEIYLNRADGITIDSGADVTGLSIGAGCRIAGNVGSGISVGSGVVGFKIIGNHIGATSHFGPNGNGIYLNGTNDGYDISHNSIVGNTGNQIFGHAAGTLTRIVKNNIGFATEAVGNFSGTVSASGQLTIPHGLGKIPNIIFVSAYGGGSASQVTAQVVSIDGTNIVVKVFSGGASPATGTYSVYWDVIY